MRDIADTSPRRVYALEDTLQFFRDLNAILDRQIELVAVGGTAMELLGLKEETKDLDFFVEGVSCEEFLSFLEKLSDKYNPGDVDFWLDGKMVLHKDGRIIEKTMPHGYKKDLPFHYSHILLRALQPIDIIMTKADRCEARDIKDIASILSAYEIKREELIARFNEHLETYDGSVERYASNFKRVLDTLRL